MTSTFALISRGYFPVEIPPPFTTKNFANYINRNKGKLPANFTNHKKNAKLMRHSIPRVGINRRAISVPNPVCFYDLCKTIEDNWNAIRHQTSTSKISKSFPKVGTAQGRAIVRYYLDGELTDFRIGLRSTSRYILVTDISQFYPSVYTHSIPWAVHGKSFAKRNRSAVHFGNLLDKCVSNGQDGQTTGIPIGPDTSLILAELVLSAMSYQIAKWIGGAAVVLKGDIDGIILTGGIANSTFVVNYIRDMVSFIIRFNSYTPICKADLHRYRSILKCLRLML